MNENEMQMFDWDSIQISDDGENDRQQNAQRPETVVLPEGEYPFSVVKVERKVYEPKRKDGVIPRCGMCKVYMRVDGGDLGKGFVSENFYVTPQNEWKIGAFLRCIGLKKHGETVMASKLLDSEGESGRCQIRVEEYTDDDGNKRTSNRLVRFIAPDEVAKPASDKAASEKPRKAFTKGAF